MLALEVTGIVAGLLCALLVVGIVLLLAFCLSKRRKEPPSPDYKAVGDFRPASVFSWDSSTSITKSLQEEHHTIQPRYGAKGTTNLAHTISDDDSSIAGSSTTNSSSLSNFSLGVKDKRTSFKDTISINSSASSRRRTLSEMSAASATSSASVDSSSFDTASIIGIKPELYTRKDSVLRQESSVASLGRLHIRIKYDFRTSDLIVHLIEAQDLSGFEQTTGFHDPFVKLRLEPAVDNKSRQSSIKRQTKNPLFNEYFKWPVGFDDLRDKRLLFQVFDFDKYSHNELVGEVQVQFDKTDVSTTVELWCDIDQASREEGLGELLVSLSYLPTAERLTTVVMKARNLKQPRASTKLDPLVRTTLCIEGKTIKRKRSSVQRGTKNPVWNEAHVFNLPQNLLENATLEFAVADHDLLGHGDIIGQCTLGKDRKGLEGMHWQDMTLNVRKAVAKWQTLKPQVR